MLNYSQEEIRNSYRCYNILSVSVNDDIVPLIIQGSKPTENHFLEYIDGYIPSPFLCGKFTK